MALAKKAASFLSKMELEIKFNLQTSEPVRDTAIKTARFFYHELRDSKPYGVLSLGSVYGGKLTRFYTAVFFTNVSLTALYLLVPLYAYSIGASQIEIGLISAVYWIAQLLLQPIFGRILGKVSNRVLLLIGIGGQGLPAIFLLFSNSVWQLLVIRLLQGVFISVFWPATRSMAADEAPPRRIGEVIGLYGVAMGLGGMAGPFFGGYISDNSGFFYAFMVANLAPAIALLPLLTGWKSEGQYKKTEVVNKNKTRDKIPGYERRILLIALLALFIHGLTYGISNSIFPVYLNILRFTKTDIGTLLMIQGLATMISQWIGGRLSDRISRTFITTLGVAFCISIGAIALEQSFAGLLVIMLTIGFGAGILYPAGLALVSELSSKRKGIGFGLFGSATTAGMAFGSQVGGALAQYTGLTAPYYVASAVTVSVTLTLVFLHRRHTNLS